MPSPLSQLQPMSGLASETSEPFVGNRARSRNRLAAGEIDEEAGEAQRLTRRMRVACGCDECLKTLLTDYAEQKWHPADPAYFRVAEEAGTLTKFMCLFQLPLRQYPDVACSLASEEGQWKTAIDKLQNVRKELDQPGDEPSLPCWHPTLEASMLANFLLVPEWKGETPSMMVLDELLDDMVVFTDDDINADNNLPAIRAKPSFPTDLGAMFVRRLITPEQIKEDTAKEDTANLSNKACLGVDAREARKSANYGIKVLSGGGCILGRREDIEGIPERIGGLPIQQQRMEYWKRRVVLTEPLSVVNLRDQQGKQAGLIPYSAKRYAFVPPGKHINPEGMEEPCKQQKKELLPICKYGGFVYVDEHDPPQLLAVNCFSEDPQRTAFCFEKAQRTLGAPELEVLKRQWFEVPDNAYYRDIIKNGYNMCAWFYRDTGGFAFFRESQGEVEQVLLFELNHKAGAGEVMQRGCFTWLRAETSMNVAMLDDEEEGLEGNHVRDAIGSVPEPWQSWCRCSRRKVHRRVSTHRVAVPGILHPLVLSGLAFARSPVCESPIAEAIAYAGFQEAMQYSIIGTLAAGFDIFVWCYFTSPRYDSGHMPMWLIYPALVTSLIKVVHNCLLGYGHYCWQIPFWKFYWKSSGITDSRPLAQLYLCGQVVVLVLTSVGEKWSQSFVGVVAGLSWLRLLPHLSCFEILDLGDSINPILKTLTQIASIVFVMLVFLASATTASIGITNMSLMNATFDTYGMAFAGDFDHDMFQATPDMLEDWAEWLPRFAVHATTGIVIMVALNNIFIAVISTNFDNNYKSARSRLVRQRAKVAFDWALLRYFLWKIGLYKEPVQQKGCLWICKPFEEPRTSCESRPDPSKEILDRLKSLEEVVKRMAPEDRGLFGIAHMDMEEREAA